MFAQPLSHSSQPQIWRKRGIGDERRAQGSGLVCHISQEGQIDEPGVPDAAYTEWDHVRGTNREKPFRST